MDETDLLASLGPSLCTPLCVHWVPCPCVQSCCSVAEQCSQQPL